MSDNYHSSPLRIRSASRFLVSDFSGTMIEMTPEKTLQDSPTHADSLCIVGTFLPLEEPEKGEVTLAATADKSEKSDLTAPEYAPCRKSRHTLATVGFGFLDRLQAATESESPGLHKLQTRDRSRTLVSFGLAS